MVQSMTGFASLTKQVETLSWTIEIRGVNAKGLDIRLRVPDKLTANEGAFKLIFSKLFSRGNINLSVRLDQSEDARGIALDESVVDSYLRAAIAVRTRAKSLGLKLTPSTAAEILSLRGVLRTGDEVQAELPLQEILSSVEDAAHEFRAMRIAEGMALATVLNGQIDRISSLVDQAAKLAEGRKTHVAETLRANLAAILETKDGLDEGRIAQELALLAVKSDVTEEIDRLRAHVDAARALLREQGSIGRKLDFLMQEFNRETNTLCAKSQNVELTQIGLDMKATIDQMREQVQNVE
ncbi:MAG: YicC/YloC family endoribonuclease [Litoreibacter sp.]